MVGPVQPRSSAPPRIGGDTDVKPPTTDAAEKPDSKTPAAAPAKKAALPGDTSATAKKTADPKPEVKGSAGSAPAPKAGDLRPKRKPASDGAAAPASPPSSTTTPVPMSARGNILTADGDVPGSTSSAPAAPAAPLPRTKSLDDLQRMAEDIVLKPTIREAAQELAKTLKDMPPGDRDELMKQVLTAVPGLGAQVIATVSQPTHYQGNLSQDDCKLIAESLGAAYERGTVKPEDLKTLIGEATKSNQSPVPLASVLAASGSPKLAAEASRQMIEIAQGGGARAVDSASFYAAAARIGATSPEATQQMLQTIGREKIGELVNALDPTRGTTYARDEKGGLLLANVLSAVSKIQPTTQEARTLFDKTVAIMETNPEANKVPELQQATAEYFTKNGYNELFDKMAVSRASQNPYMRKALGDFFQQYMPQLTERLSKSSNDKERAVLTEFARNVLFSDSWDGQAKVRKAFAESIGARVQELQSAPKPKNLEEQSRLDEKARQLGALVGGTEVGFERAAKDVKDENAHRHAMVDFVFTLAGKAGLNDVPSITIPGVGDIKSMIVDGAKSKLYGMVDKGELDANSLSKPLYDLARAIPRDYHDEMKSERDNYYVDEQRGYIPKTKR
jgi:hypothetical protein